MDRSYANRCPSDGSDGVPRPHVCVTPIRAFPAAAVEAVGHCVEPGDNAAVDSNQVVGGAGPCEWRVELWREHNFIFVNE